MLGLVYVDGYFNSLLSFIDKDMEEGFIGPNACQIIVSTPTTKRVSEEIGGDFHEMRYLYFYNVLPISSFLTSKLIVYAVIFSYFLLSTTWNNLVFNSQVYVPCHEGVTFKLS